MILVRDVFRLRFGKAREAVALWREGLDALRRSHGVQEARLLTDLTGPYYTLVLETSVASLAEFERGTRETMNDPAWREWYARFTPLVESGYREIFSVVGSEVPSLPTAGALAAAIA